MEQPSYQTSVAAEAATEREARPSTNKHGCCADKACTDKTCMELPAGKTCGDCRHFRHCAAFYAHLATDTYCDFFPRRFAATGTPRRQQ